MYGREINKYIKQNCAPSWIYLRELIVRLLHFITSNEDDATYDSNRDITLLEFANLTSIVYVGYQMTWQDRIF